jgi:hypothetical protein
MNRSINHRFLPLLPPPDQRVGERRGVCGRTSPPESGLAITSSAAPVDGGSARGRKRIGGSKVASPSPRPSPLGRGGIARRAFANPGRLESSRRGMRCSLSQREIVAARSARVRGNETQPTKAAGRILQAQLDRLPAGAASLIYAVPHRTNDGQDARRTGRLEACPSAPEKALGWSGGSPLPRGGEPYGIEP